MKYSRVYFDHDEVVIRVYRLEKSGLPDFNSFIGHIFFNDETQAWKMHWSGFCSTEENTEVSHYVKTLNQPF